jgi:hypothetical protein
MFVGTAWIAAVFAIANLFGSIEFAIAVGCWILLHWLMIGTAKALLWCKTKATT